MKTILTSASALSVGFACALALSTATALAEQLWEKRYDGPGLGVDRATAVAVDGAGNVAVTGFSENATDDPNNSVGNYVYNENGRTDYYTAKYAAADGHLLWEVRFNGPGRGNDVATDVKMDSTGNVIVTGYSLDKSGGSSLDESGYQETYTAKYAATDRTLVWERRGPLWNGNGSIKLALDSSGNVIVTGGSWYPGVPGGFYTAKYAAGNGGLLWEQRYSEPNQIGGTFPEAVVVDGGGNVIVTGTATKGTYENPDADSYTVKYSADGVPLWSVRYDRCQHDNANGVAVDPSGNVIVTARSYESATSQYFHTAKYAAADGTLVWEHFYPAFVGSGFLMAVDGGGNVVVSVPASPIFPIWNGILDYYTAKYAAADGVLVWEHVFDDCGHGSDYPKGLALDSAGNAIVTGVAGAHFVYYTEKYAVADGHRLWRESYVGLPDVGGGEPAAVILDNAGNLIVTGSSGNAAGIKDYYTVKYPQNSAQPGPGTINCPANIVTSTSSGQCSAVVNYTAPTAIDECGNPQAVACSPPSGSIFPKGMTTVTCTAADGSSCSFTVTVQNPSPTVAITGPSSGAVYAVGTPVTFTGSFTDNPGDTHSAQWLVDSFSFAGTVNEANGQVTATASFSSPGVYLVKLAVTDNCGNTATAETVGGLLAMVVIYDPTGGYVTGGGWFNSPDGACTSQPTLTGKASFGFVSRYQKGATVPTGETEFQFQVANFNFHSTSYEWLVISGARAQYKGSGTVNNAGSYGFILTAIDGAVRGGGGADKFRIKIWDKSNNGAIVYDNQLDALDSADLTTAISGGSVVVHAQ